MIRMLHCRMTRHWAWVCSVSLILGLVLCRVLYSQKSGQVYLSLREVTVPHSLRLVMETHLEIR